MNETRVTQEAGDVSGEQQLLHPALIDLKKRLVHAGQELVKLEEECEKLKKSDENQQNFDSDDSSCSSDGDNEGNINKRVLFPEEEDFESVSQVGGGGGGGISRESRIMKNQHKRHHQYGFCPSTEKGGREVIRLKACIEALKKDCFPFSDSVPYSFEPTVLFPDGDKTCEEHEGSSATSALSMSSMSELIIEDRQMAFVRLVAETEQDREEMRQTRMILTKTVDHLDKQICEKKAVSESYKTLERRYTQILSSSAEQISNFVMSPLKKSVTEQNEKEMQYYTERYNKIKAFLSKLLLRIDKWIVYSDDQNENEDSSKGGESILGMFLQHLWQVFVKSLSKKCSLRGVGEGKSEDGDDLIEFVDISELPYDISDEMLTFLVDIYVIEVKEQKSSTNKSEVVDCENSSGLMVRLVDFTS